MGTSNNCLIIRDKNFQPGRIYNSKNSVTIKWRELDVETGNNATFVRSTIPRSNHIKSVNKRNVSLPQISLKRKMRGEPNAVNNEVRILNELWDKSTYIRNLAPVMHNVNIEELQVLHDTWDSNKLVKSQKFDMETSVSPSAGSSDSGVESDCTDGNLSWLLNYRIHELPPVPDCAITDPYSAQINNKQNRSNGKINHDYIVESIPKQYFEQQTTTALRSIQEKENVNRREGGSKPAGNSYRHTGPKKPPFTYTELIEHALNEKGELTVSGIYQWISDRFPFYKQNDDRWKNSVRHNLSINPHFRKGSKAVHGAGHLWTIAQREDKKTWNIKKQKIQQFIQSTCNEYNHAQLEVELETATASILPDCGDNYEKNCFSTINHDIFDKQQNVQIQYVNVIDVSANGLEDFLCPPVSKEEMAEECGLNGDYLITDLNPNTLGLNLAEADTISNGNLYDELSFQCYELQEQ